MQWKFITFFLLLMVTVGLVYLTLFCAMQVYSELLNAKRERDNLQHYRKGNWTRSTPPEDSLSSLVKTTWRNSDGQ